MESRGCLPNFQDSHFIRICQEQNTIGVSPYAKKSSERIIDVRGLVAVWGYYYCSVWPYYVRLYPFILERETP